MRVDLFDFDLDKELIAKEPANPRDASRLLDLSEEGVTVDRHFYDLPDILHSGDVLVFNDTKVIPARLYGKRGEAEVEVTLYHPENGQTWWAFVKNSKRLHPEDEITFYTSEIAPEKSLFKARVVEKRGEDGVLLEFLCPVDNLSKMLETYGMMPLPPYITRQLEDQSQYQTVYAKELGSAAAPTAGLHFTPELLDTIRAKGVNIVEVTLHVGLGTFRPVSEDNIQEHQMHTEWYCVDDTAAEAINAARASGHRVIAVGTTSCRTLEAVWAKYGKIVPCSGTTDIFLYPGVELHAIDGLVTNFHLPESTLIMLISAFYGYEKTMAAYKVAVQEKYRFFSFGDAMFIQ